MKIRVEVADRVLQSSAFPLTWCVDAEAAEALDGKEAYLLVWVVPTEKALQNTASAGDYAHRYLFPLQDRKGYIACQNPGRNTIISCVVWPSDIAKTFKKLRREFAPRGAYANAFDLDAESADEGEDYAISSTIHGIFNLDNGLLMTWFEVEAPQEAFAPPPPAWEKPWVHWVWSYTAEDQCDYRKLRLFAYTFQPFWFVFVYLLRIVVLILQLGWGWVPATHKILTSPLSYGLDDSIKGLYGKATYYLPANWGAALSPLLWIGLGFLYATLGMITFLSALGGCVFVGLLIVAVIWWTEVRPQRLEENPKPRPVVKRSQLTCEAPRRHSIRLIFDATKAAVCRPFPSRQ